MLRLGVIGAGLWAVQSHLPVLSQRPEVEFTAVCRRGEEELRSVAAQFGFASATEDYREMLDRELDICVVASPASLHYEHAEAALRAGCHTLLEKPVTLHADEAWALVDLAQRMDRHLVIAFGWNYSRPYVEASRLMDKHGGVGRVEHVSVLMASGTRALLSGTSLDSTASSGGSAEHGTWTDPALSGGGYGQAQVPHGLGLALGLSGLRIDSVEAVTFPQTAGIELHCSIAMRFVGGATGTVSGASFDPTCHGARHQMQVNLYGDRGQLELDFGHERLWLWRDDGVDETVPFGPTDNLYDCIGPPNALVDLALGKPVINYSPGELGARTVEVLEAAYGAVEK